MVSKVEPIAKEAIDEAKKHKAIVATCIDGYVTDKEAILLKDLLWYARDNGVVVHFVPLENEKGKKD